MTTIMTIAATCFAGCMLVQALDVGARLRLAFVAAQWSALFWIGLRVASMAFNTVA